ncbi:MAG: ABC transporter ATP-binding protein [Pseudohongiellaceae bacterium]
MNSISSQIATKDLRLDYGELTAVNNVNLHIPAGEIYGLVGPNGAGKTSLLKMLANLITPTYGELWIAGIDLSEQPRSAYQLMGYMPDLSPVAPELKVWEFLEYFAASYGIPRDKRLTRVNECLDAVDMTEHRDVYGKALSRGMTQKVVLAKTLIPSPKILLLDEPASGMDPLARINLKNLLLELSGQGVTTIISSHILTELEDMCTSIGVMDRGKLLRSGELRYILDEYAVRILAMEAIDGLDTAERLLLARPDVSVVMKTGKGLTLEFSGDEEDEAALLRELIIAGVKVTSFHRKGTRMEDTLINLVSRNKNSENSAVPATGIDQTESLL